MPPLLLVAFALVATLAAVIVRRRFFHPLSAFPGPFWASATANYRTWYYLKGNQHLHHRKLHEKYGPIVRYAPDALIFADYKSLPYIYHLKADKTKFYDSHLGETPTVFSQKTHASHVHARRRLSFAYSMGNIKLLEPSIKDLIHDWRRGLESQIGTPIDLASYVHWLAYDVVGLVAFGRPFGFIDSWSDVRDLIAASSKPSFFLEMLNLQPQLSWFARNTSLGRRLLLPKPSDRSGVGPLMAERDEMWTSFEIEGGTERSEACLLRRMITNRSSGKSSFDDEDIRSELLIAILAGAGTTSNALTSALINVAANKSCSARLAAEIDTAAALASSSEPTHNTISRLPHLSSCIREAFRYSSAGTQFPRIVSADSCDFGGQRIPPGTHVSSSTYIISRSTELYGERVDEFWPERWLEADADAETRKRWNSFEFRFGFGARTCLGKNLVEVELCNAVFEVFRNFEVDVVDKDKNIVTLKSRRST